MDGRSRTRNAVFILAGVIIILVGTVVVDRTNHPDLHELLVAVGVVVLSVSILELLFILGGGNPVERKMEELSTQIERLSKAVNIIERAKSVGLSEMHDFSANFGGKTAWFELMNSAKGSMDLMGRTLNEWIRAPEFDDIIVRKIVQDNVQFRWLVMSIENRHLEQLEEDGKKIGESVRHKIKPMCDRLAAIRARLPVEKNKLLELRTYKHVPLYCSVLRVDDKFLITPYLQSVGARNSPLIIVEGRATPWARIYEREFDMMWRGSQPELGSRPDCE